MRSHIVTFELVPGARAVSRWLWVDWDTQEFLEMAREIREYDRDAPDMSGYEALRALARSRVGIELEDGGVPPNFRDLSTAFWQAVDKGRYSRASRCREAWINGSDTGPWRFMPEGIERALDPKQGPIEVTHHLNLILEQAAHLQAHLALPGINSNECYARLVEMFPDDAEAIAYHAGIKHAEGRGLDR